jgi:hypothetical protein
VGSVDAAGIAIMAHFFGIIMLIIGLPIVTDKSLRKEPQLYKGGILNFSLGIIFMLIAAIVLADKTDWYLSLLLLFSLSIAMTVVALAAMYYFVSESRDKFETVNIFMLIAMIFFVISGILNFSGYDVERGAEVIGFK